MKYFKLFLLLSLVLCIQLTLADKTKRNKCPKNMALVRCSTEFQGVCAFFKQNKHDKHLSQKYSANGCIACTDSRVKYTEEGACNGKKVFCDANIRPEFCTKEYFPVCGYNSKCKGDDCGIPAGNKCMACANPEIEWYVQGECPEKSNVVTCDPKNRPEICPAIYQPVCATVKTCKGKVCTTTTRTVGSGCTACGDASVISYVPGECPPVVTQCDPKNRPDFCTKIYDPVCATLEVCTGSVCTRTAGNACSACSDPNVISHIPGECPIVVTQCDPKNRPEFCTDIYDPVCATIEECSRRGCTQRTQTIANGCDACATKNVVSHVPGECSM